MRFTKMHGAGNDYVFIDCLHQIEPECPADLTRRVSDRHVGVGSDGLVLILPSDCADLRMRMFNADGSEAEMCGNALRCVAQLAWDRNWVWSREIRIETGRGVLTAILDVVGFAVRTVRVKMGRPILEAGQIPTTLAGDPPIDVPVEIDGVTFGVTCVSMGNPHCVVYVDVVSAANVHRWGPLLEHSEYFPQRTNVEFVQVENESSVQIRVWERGTGETLACGTGACAVLVAGVLSGRTGRHLTARMPGGDLEIDWPEGDEVSLSGPVTEVFTGNYCG